MDLFSKNRTFLVLFGILVIFIIIILQYFGYSFVETFKLEQDYPDEWNDGVKINIRSWKQGSQKYKRQDLPFKSNFNGEAKCNDLCKKQPECVDKGNDWKNECTAEYSSVDRSCYCAFQKVEAFSTMNPFKRLCNEMKVCPSWPLDNSAWNTTSWTPIVRKNNIATWKDTSISDINNMSMSFWIYFDESLGETRPMTSIIQIAKPSYKGDSDWKGKDRYIGVFALPERPVLSIRTMTDNDENIGDDTEFSNDKDGIGGYEIGYKPIPSFVVITFKNGVCTYYKNGKFQNRYGKYPILPPPEDAVLMSGITYNPYNAEAKGISIKDFRMYDRAILGHDIEILYDGIQHSGVSENFETIRGAEPESTVINMNVENAITNKSKNYMEASWKNKDNNLISSSFFVNKYKNEVINEGFETAAPIQSNKITMENLVLRSSTAQKCNRSKGASERANNQQSVNHGKPIIAKAIVHFRNRSSADFTQLIQNTLNMIDSDPNFNPSSGHEQLLDSVRIEIHIVHVWSRHLKKFEIEYSNIKEFKWKILADRIKCLNSDDHSWDNANSKCNFEGHQYICTDSAPTCVNYTSWIRWGNCSAANPLVYKSETITIENGRKKQIKYVDLAAANEGHLDIVVDDEKEKQVLFGPNGTTISMWFRVNPEKRKNTTKWCRLLNFGNRRWRWLDDEVCVAIEGDMTRDRLVFNVNGRIAGKGSQVLDNDWHHIAWVMDKERSQWRYYHHGRSIGHSDNMIYPENKPRHLKMVGGPGVDWDDFWGAHIADFRIYGKALEDNEIRNIYFENSVP